MKLIFKKFILAIFVFGVANQVLIAQSPPGFQFQQRGVDLGNGNVVPTYITTPSGVSQLTSCLVGALTLCMHPLMLTLQLIPLLECSIPPLLSSISTNQDNLL